MPDTVTELLNAALTLSEVERAELSELLAATLTTATSSLHGRVDDIHSGRVERVSWEEVRRQVQAQFDYRMG